MIREKSFWAKVSKTDRCWAWMASVTPRGYGQFQVGSGRGAPSMMRAHRVSWVLAFGDIPEGLCVLHRCDNRRCVRPDHLFLGTPADNSADMVSKGRQGPRGMLKGERNPSTRVPDEDVRQIRCLSALGVKQTWIASTFGVWRQTVYGIASGRQRGAQ